MSRDAQHTLVAHAAVLACATFVAMLVPVARAHAQTSQTGVLQGDVRLESGRVVANATITIQQRDGSYPRVAQADEYGRYRISFVTPGVYDLSVRLIGFRAARYEGLVLRAAEVHDQPIVLTLARTELAPLTVNASGAVIRTITQEFATSIQSRERELLPTARNANALIGFTPGARPDQIFGGSTAQANLYQLDGVMVNQPGTGGSFLLPNIDWIEDFKVIGLGSGAEYGNFQGGLVNIVTKSGSNTLRGQVRTFYENRSLNASNVNAFENGAELDNRTEVNAELRGPLVRNRVYYYLSMQESRSEERVVDFNNSAVGSVSWLDPRTARRESKYYGKLTWQATEQDIFNASFGVDNLSRERVGLSAYTAIDATYEGRSPSAFFQSNWQRSFTNRSFLELKLSGYSGEDNELSYGGRNLPSVRLLDAPNSPQFVNASFSRENSPSSLGLTASYDAYFNVGSVQHNVKLGGEYVAGLWREQRSRTGGLSWYTEAGTGFDPSNPATWQTIPSLGVYATADTGGRIDLDADTRNSALFVQDYVRVNDHLSLSAGVRYGRWLGSLTPGYGGGFRGSRKFEAVSAMAFDPRVGATVDVFGDASLVAKAHWGRYHQNLFALFFDRAPGANVFTNIEFCDWNNTDKRVLPEIGRQYTPAEFGALFTCFPGSNLFNEARQIENYQQPYMEQFTVGVEQSLGRGLKAELLYVNRRNRAVLSLVDSYLESNWSPIVNVAVREGSRAVRGVDGEPVVLPVIYVRNDNLRSRLAAGDVIPGYTRADTAALGFTQDLVIRQVDEAQRTFDQLQLSLSGSYSRWQFNGALAYTNLTGNLFSVNGYFNPSGQENGPFVERNGQINFDGKLGNYSPWDFKLRASGTLLWGFEGGAFLTYRSGDLWTPSLNLSRQLAFNAEGAGGGQVALDERLFQGALGQNILVEPRGNRQFDGQGNLDLRLQRVFGIGANDVILGLELFNALGGDAITSLNESLNNQGAGDPTSLVGAVRFRQRPTTLRLNIQFRL